MQKNNNKKHTKFKILFLFPGIILVCNRTKENTRNGHHVKNKARLFSIAS